MYNSNFNKQPLISFFSLELQFPMNQYKINLQSQKTHEMMPRLFHATINLIIQCYNNVNAPHSKMSNETFLQHSLVSPSVTSNCLNKRSAMVDFPEAVLPTMAIFCPGFNSKLTLSRALIPLSLKVKPTFLKMMCPSRPLSVLALFYSPLNCYQMLAFWMGCMSHLLLI